MAEVCKILSSLFMKIAGQNANCLDLAGILENISGVAFSYRHANGNARVLIWWNSKDCEFRRIQAFNSSENVRVNLTNFPPAKIKGF